MLGPVPPQHGSLVLDAARSLALAVSGNERVTVVVRRDTLAAAAPPAAAPPADDKPPAAEAAAGPHVLLNFAVRTAIAGAVPPPVSITQSSLGGAAVVNMVLPSGGSGLFSKLKALATSGPHEYELAIEIIVPAVPALAGFGLSIALRTFGVIQLHDLGGPPLGAVALSLNAGTIDIGGLAADSLDVSAQAGSIAAADVITAARHAHLETEAGRIDVAAVSAQSVLLRSSAGTIAAGLVSFANSFTASTRLGEIRTAAVECIEAPPPPPGAAAPTRSVSIDVGAGKFTGSLAGHRFLTASVEVGTISATTSPAPGSMSTFKTKAGTIHLQLPSSFRGTIRRSGNFEIRSAAAVGLPNPHMVGDPALPDPSVVEVHGTPLSKVDLAFV
ncbi:hypothetical protein HK105_200400 [Polyrhizophydium stewartii]|uniref:Adhesin domain-containing protein n=1 Tax=Polyrhizophydium stewartii TaxID=2732419 RepID=A0ABR4NLC7_9FUNG|nr:hypothetical protein HK105_008151 [Polyrhizophydium stewartii]